ncbi:death-inducer obliterator 1 isoform X1 [Helicoverpa zea]|uniref:death-inducer obliterator 1 isoform X1 n=1 Tax=Helicoverpa zea TaxID=7113 RepID=UPI001F595510|nr:death-inducer obliterator 1 isoform X1 [Helicoverpa zea]
MSNTVITNYTDLNGPSTKADSSVVVIVNKDGSLSVDQKLLGTLMGTDGSQSTGISVVRVGHEGKPDDATDSDTDDEKVPHVTLSVDSYYDEPNSIIKYDSGAEMLQSLRIETRENSLVGFQNDHCYTPLKSPSQSLPQQNDNLSTYDESVIEITHTPPPKPVPNSKKITILEQQIIPKGKKIVINPTEAPIILKGKDVLNKLLPINKSKESKDLDKPSDTIQKGDDSTESSSISSSGDSIPDRDSDSDYKDTKDRTGSLRLKKTKLKPRILKTAAASKASKLESKLISKLKPARSIIKKEIKEKLQYKNVLEKKDPSEVDLESLLPSSKISTVVTPGNEVSKVISKQTPKPIKKEKKTPAHVTALLSDMTSLFSTPDVIRRVSTDGKVPPKTPTSEKESLLSVADKKPTTVGKAAELSDGKISDISKLDSSETLKPIVHKTYVKPKEKTKPYDPIPQLDDASLAQILQDTTGISNTVKSQPTISTGGAMNSPSLAGPLSPTLDLLGGLQPEEEGLTEDFLMSVAQLVASSENLQEVIDKQVLGKVDSGPIKTPQTTQSPQTPQQPTQATTNLYTQTLSKSVPKTMPVRKDPIEIVRRDGRVITLPPIEAPATRSSKRKSQMEVATNPEPAPVPTPPAPVHPVSTTPEPQVQAVSKQYINKKLSTKKQEQPLLNPVLDKLSAESQESWNSEDDPNRLWCICKQPHNNRFMICCDGCEDWFHGKCVNITKAMGQQMEEQGIEWRCPNCIKKAKPSAKGAKQLQLTESKIEPGLAPELKSPTQSPAVKDSKTSCIVCKKPARASSIYCSNSCIWKHAQDSLGSQGPSGKGDGEPGKSNEKQKAESRVIVYERKSGRLLAGANAPTAENLKSWLQQHPTFEVVRPGTLSTIKPGLGKKKTSEPNKIQTTLNFERIPRKPAEQATPQRTPNVEPKERSIRLISAPKEEPRATPQLKSPVTPKSQPPLSTETPKASTSTAKPAITARKLIRTPSSHGQSSQEKAPSVSPSTSRRKDTHSRIRMSSGEPIRDNVRKALQEQLSIRMSENTGPKFTEAEIQQFANDTESELHELFRDVGMKYKAKYRSLMFNIKDRKNLTLWQKICDRSITPKQLVRLSPEELASQELAQWRDKEAKHQLELIKKSELDLLAASKTYVLKTHKGEEVMETKESVTTELDANVPVEDVVTALNDSTVGPDVLSQEKSPENNSKGGHPEKKVGKKRNRDDSSSGRSKRSRRESKRDSDRKSRSAKRRSESTEKETRTEQRRSTRRSDKKSSRARSVSKDRSKESKEKPDSADRKRDRSSSREKSRRRSKSTARDRSRSPTRSRRRSPSRDSPKPRDESRSKRTNSSDDKQKHHRSRSQDNIYTKIKNDSTDSDSIERPKSAMMKDAHPEYDPHEPMITSAFSEEDLRKSREDVFEENYRNDMISYEAEYDPSKSLIDNNIILPGSRFSTNQDKTSEAESDQEPSSTVDNSAATVWSGCINMVDVARFYVAAHEVSGSSVDLEEDLSTELDIVGRINPDTVWEYIAKMKKTSTKDIVILKLQTANDEEKMQYIALYSYLSSRNRLGVVKSSNMMTVKDFYIVPLPANTALPAVLLPLDGPGIGDIKTHLLIAIVIRQRKKRLHANIPTDVVPAKVARESRKRSYTPPASPRRRPPLPLPAYPSSSLSTTVKDKIAASLVSADDDEPYSPGSTSSSGSGPSSSGPSLASNTLRSKMEELNRQIEEQKQQILKMAQADSSIGEDEEAYSPSRPMTPPPVQNVPLADIALPSNLQEILATIKQRSETTTADVDMRTLPLP